MSANHGRDGITFGLLKSTDLPITDLPIMESSAKRIIPPHHQDDQREGHQNDGSDFVDPFVNFFPGSQEKKNGEYNELNNLCV